MPTHLLEYFLGKHAILLPFTYSKYLLPILVVFNYITYFLRGPDTTSHHLRLGKAPDKLYDLGSWENYDC